MKMYKFQIIVFLFLHHHLHIMTSVVASWSPGLRQYWREIIINNWLTCDWISCNFYWIFVNWVVKKRYGCRWGKSASVIPTVSFSAQQITRESNYTTLNCNTRVISSCTLFHSTLCIEIASANTLLIETPS